MRCTGTGQSNLKYFLFSLAIKKVYTFFTGKFKDYLMGSKLLFTLPFSLEDA
jgi:hypothetical protein